MNRVGILATLQSRPGKEAEVEQFSSVRSTSCRGRNRYDGMVRLQNWAGYVWHL